MDGCWCRYEGLVRSMRAWFAPGSCKHEVVVRRILDERSVAGRTAVSTSARGRRGARGGYGRLPKVDLGLLRHVEAEGNRAVGADRRLEVAGELRAAREGRAIGTHRLPAQPARRLHEKRGRSLSEKQGTQHSKGDGRAETKLGQHGRREASWPFG
eukprot:5247835-Prymnesium_polylepis.1